MVVVPFMGESIEDGSLIAILKRKWLPDGCFFSDPVPRFKRTILQVNWFFFYCSMGEYSVKVGFGFYRAGRFRGCG